MNGTEFYFKQGIMPEKLPGNKQQTNPQTAYDVNAKLLLLKNDLRKIASKRVKGFKGFTPAINHKSVYSLERYIDILKSPKLYSPTEQKKPLTVMDYDTE